MQSRAESAAPVVGPRRFAIELAPATPSVAAFSSGKSNDPFITVEIEYSRQQSSTPVRAVSFMTAALLFGAWCTLEALDCMRAESACAGAC
jgi:hypothetical protein